MAACCRRIRGSERSLAEAEPCREPGRVIAFLYPAERAENLAEVGCALRGETEHGADVEIIGGVLREGGDRRCRDGHERDPPRRAAC
jgi:hypothetical protein